MSCPLDETENGLLCFIFAPVSESRVMFSYKVSELASGSVDGCAGSALETVTGVEPALTELQSAAFPLGYTVVLVPAERIELTSSASEADVLPLDEAELSPPYMGGSINWL